MARIHAEHPRLLFSSSQLKAITGAVQKGEEPFASAWKNLKKRSENSLGYVANPYTGDNSDLFYKSCLGSAGLARNLALAWHLSGEKKYAEKAAEILNTWALACLAKRLDHTQDYPNTLMKVARAAFPFVCAYDRIPAPVSRSGYRLSFQNHSPSAL